MIVEQLKKGGIFKPSLSEDNAIRYLEGRQFQSLKSIGISTAGYFEGYWAERKKQVTATTLDTEGIEYSKEILTPIWEKITWKLEDVTKTMPEEDQTYDVVYSRLCLHYISDADLEKALSECYRVLKKEGLFICVVKSINDWTAKTEGAYYEEETGFTVTPNITRYATSKRRLHSKQTISMALEKAGFQITRMKELAEKICEDYKRQVWEKTEATVIEVYANK